MARVKPSIQPKVCTPENYHVDVFLFCSLVVPRERGLEVSYRDVPFKKIAFSKASYHKLYFLVSVI